MIYHRAGIGVLNDYGTRWFLNDTKIFSIARPISHVLSGRTKKNISITWWSSQSPLFCSESFSPMILEQCAIEIINRTYFLQEVFKEEYDKVKIKDYIRIMEANKVDGSIIEPADNFVDSRLFTSK